MKKLTNKLGYAICILLMCVFCVGCESKKDCLFRMHCEQSDKLQYYYKKAMDFYPTRLDSFYIYGDSLDMACYAMNAIKQEWDNAR